MLISKLHSLYDYNYWATARILATAAKADPDALLKDTGLAHGSVTGVLNHVLAGEWVWRVRCQEGRSPKALREAGKFADLVSLRRRWVDEEQAMRGYVAGLSETDLERVLRYSSTNGQEYDTVIWQILWHLMNHGTQHRAEAGAELTRLGHSPGDIDYMVYVRQVREFSIKEPRL